MITVHYLGFLRLVVIAGGTIRMGRLQRSRQNLCGQSPAATCLTKHQTLKPAKNAAPAKSNLFTNQIKGLAKKFDLLAK
jgi:hypothetical protein